MEGSRLEGAAGGAVTLRQRGGGGLEERSAEINTLIDWLIYLSSLTQTDYIHSNDIRNNNGNLFNSTIVRLDRCITGACCSG